MSKVLTLPSGMEDCAIYHTTNVISLYEGLLYGLPGPYHHANTNNFGLNVFLAHEFVPNFIPLLCGVGGKRKAVNTPPTIAFLFPDRCQPSIANDQAFDAMLAQITAHLKRGKSVAVSCEHGHGRTGLVLACLWGEAHPEDPSPIESIRTKICKGMVDTYSQAEFVHSWLGLPPPERRLTIDDEDPQRVRDPLVKLDSDREILLNPLAPLVLHHDLREDAGRLYCSIDGEIVPAEVVDGHPMAKYRCPFITCGGQMAIVDGVFRCQVCSALGVLPPEWKDADLTSLDDDDDEMKEDAA